MKQQKMIIEKCAICHEDKLIDQLCQVEDVQAPIKILLDRAYPNLNKTDWICDKDLNHFRLHQVYEVINKERDHLHQLETNIDIHLKEVKNNIHHATDYHVPLTKGQKISDQVAKFGGSWKFIITFSVIFILWVSMNSLIHTRLTFDPYPFILLNLILSCITALQAPVIMMSQNRQETKDRKHLEHDYKVNLRTEQEVKMLQKKIDLLTGEWISLLEIQAVQLEMLEQVTKQLSLNNKNGAP